MRVLLVLVLVLLMPLSAMAAGWSHYSNARFGYAIEVPDGFIGQGKSENGDGQMFKTPTAKLTRCSAAIVDGGPISRSEVRRANGLPDQDGWAITYAVSTPRKASFSGVKRGGQLLYARMIALCGGSSSPRSTSPIRRSDHAEIRSEHDQLFARLRRPTDRRAARGSHSR